MNDMRSFSAVNGEEERVRKRERRERARERERETKAVRKIERVSEKGGRHGLAECCRHLPLP